MNALRPCRFCNIAAGVYHYGKIDEPFASDNDFFAVASIGALIEGWSLIIPKEHQLSMRNVYRSEAFGTFVSSVLPLLGTKYGDLVAFEHGSAREGSITACGTDHAHLHIVPLNGSLLLEMKGQGMQWIECRSSEIASRSQLNEYLFYCELRSRNSWQDPRGYLHILQRPISQFFRHIIAQRFGRPETFDYRRFPHLETAVATRTALARSAA